MQDTLWGEEECIPLQSKPRPTMQAHQETERQHILHPFHNLHSS